MNHARDVDARASEWLSRKDAGDWSAADQARLDRWLDEATEHRVSFLRLSAVWRQADRLAELDAAPSPRRWSARLAWPVAIAASLVATVSGTAWLALSEPTVVHATAIGQHDEVRLRDGTDLALNTDTRLLAVVDHRSREVWLDKGEAYFEVAHDPAHPFVIHAGRQTVTVLGTRFSVRLEDGRFRLAVTEGRVRVDGAGVERSGRPVILTKGEVATASDRDMLVTRETAERLRDDIAWRDGTLVFDRVALADAVAEFNRYSERKLVVADPSVAAIRIGGRFSTDNVEGFARLIQTGLGLNVAYRPSEIIFTG